MNFRPYISLARVDSWTKNLVVLVGVLLAYMLSASAMDWFKLALTLAVVCLASSANYVLNESIDSKSDAYHPIKKKRASVKHTLNKKIILMEYALLVCSAVAISTLVHASVTYITILYLACALVYNIPPVRFKDKAYLDVLLESVNYPLRVVFGWFCVLPDVLPPSSVIVVAWSLGAFTMSIKRLAELDLFENRETAILYRRSYARYSIHSLALCGFVYALCTVFGITVLLMKYKIELILIVPTLIALLSWYFLMGLQRKLYIIYPERLLSNSVFLVLCAIMLVTAVVVSQSNIPSLHKLEEVDKYLIRH